MPYNPKRPRYWMSDSDVSKILRAAKHRNETHYQVFRLLRWGLRLGEITGNRKRLRGIRYMDLRLTGIRILGKNQTTDTFYPLPRRFMADVRRYARSDPRSHLPTDRVFQISDRTIEIVLKRYARRTGIQDWERVSPHRLRAYFATAAKDKGLDSFTIRDLMRHKNLTTTNLYVGVSTPAHLLAVVERLAR